MNATPGPYQISRDFNIVSPDGRTVGTCGGHSNNTHPIETDAENRANARLLAASWEMREKLIQAAAALFTAASYLARDSDIRIAHAVESEAREIRDIIARINQES